MNSGRCWTSLPTRAWDGEVADAQIRFKFWPCVLTNHNRTIEVLWPQDVELLFDVVPSGPPKAITISKSDAAVLGAIVPSGPTG